MNYLPQNLAWLLIKSNEKSKDLPSVNLSESYLKSITQRKAEPTIEELIRISEFYEISIERLIFKDLAEVNRLISHADIKLLVLDVDGVLTDGGMYFTKDGDEVKKFNVKDGMAINNLKSKGVKVGFLSAGIEETIIRKRAEMLGVDYFFVGKKPKLETLNSWMKKENINYDNVLYVGDDINDVPIMEKVILSACPADAIELVKQKASVVLEKKGGEGCVRELIDTYLLGL